MQTPSELIRFISELQQSLQSLQFSKLVLSRYHGGEDLQRIAVDTVLIKDQTQLRFVYSYKTRDITKNFSAEEALKVIDSALSQGEFRQANLLTEKADIQLAFSKKGKPLYRHTALKTSREQKTDAAHNREKQRYLDLQKPYLTHLGITDHKQQLIPAMSRKWKQINKFIEIIAGAIKSTQLAQKDGLKIADFGSGKAYLTFAVHDYVRNHLHLDAEVIGVELRQNLVDLCNTAAQELALDGLRFEQGDVQHYQTQGLDVMIALHACDVATDYAIHMGIRAGADIIMCSPCCHKQIRPQLKMPNVLKPMLSHGIHLGQEAEMLTDSLRALLLEANGYDTQVFEFIALEHISKNKMILATKRKQARDNSAILQQISDIKAFYGIEQHCLETLLNA